MKKPDKFLLVIIVGVVLLVGFAVLVVFLKPKPVYVDDGTPDGVAYNYLLALQLEEYDRAYPYLSNTLPGYPSDLNQFEKSIENYSWSFRRGSDVSLAIDSTDIGDTRAVVTVRETRFYNQGLFESSQRISVFDMVLERDGTQWKIIESDNYFAWCWENESGCRY